MDYKDWPLFKEFRKTNQFKVAYENIYSETFEYIEEDTEEEIE